MSLIDFASPWEFETPDARKERESTKFRSAANSILEDFQRKREEEERLRREEESRRFREAIQPQVMEIENQQAEAASRNAESQRFREMVQPEIEAFSVRRMFEDRQRESERFREMIKPTLEENGLLGVMGIPEEEAKPQPGETFTDFQARMRERNLNIPSGPDISSKTEATTLSPNWAFQSILPREAVEGIGKIPVVGEEAERITEAFTSPTALATAPLGGAGLFAKGAAGAFAGGLIGQGLEEAGVPVVDTPIGGVGPRGVLEGVGGLYGTKGGVNYAAKDFAAEEAKLAGRQRLMPRLTQGLQGAADSPEQSALAKLDEVLSKQPADWEETLKVRHQELSERVAEATRIRDEALAEGLSPAEAVGRSTEALRGKMPITKAAGFDFTPQEEAWLWDKILEVDYFKQVNLGKMLEDMANDPERVIRPFEKRYLEEAVGKAVADKMEQVATTRATVVKRMSAAEREAAAFAKESAWPTREVDLSTRFGPEPTQPPIPGISKELEPRLPSVSGTSYSETFPGFGSTVSSAEKVLPKKDPYIIDIMADSLGLPRAIMASGDLSFLRQTSKTAGRHPLLAKDAVVKATKAAASEETAIQWMKELESDSFMVNVRMPNGGIKEIRLGDLARDKLHMAVPGTPEFATSGIMSRPEFFVSRKGANLPIIRQSGRGYAVGVNTSMQGVARYWLGKMMKWNGGSIPSEQVDAVLNLTKRLNGQGELGSSWFAQTVKALGFAPGYRISGPEAFANLLRNPLKQSNRQIQRMAAEELFTWASLGSSILSAVKYAVPGATVFTAVGSPFFGRVQFPGSDTVYNIWGTDQVLARTILQAAAKKKVNRLGEETTLGSGEGGVKGYLTAARDATVEYLRSGQDPLIGLIAEITSGEDYKGDKIGWNMASVKKLVEDRMPMAAQDIKAIAETDGPIQAIVSAPYVMLGGGATSYLNQKEKLAREYDAKAASGAFGPDAKPYTEEVSTVRSSRIAGDEELNKLNMERDTVSQQINTETEQPLIPIAQAVNRNAPEAGKVYREQRKTILKERLDRKDQQFKDRPQSVREVDKMVDAYAEMDPTDTNGNGFIDSQDMKIFLDSRKKLLSTMPPDVQAAIKDTAKAFGEGGVITAERRYQTALDAYTTYLDTPKYKGLTVEQGDMVDAMKEAMTYVRVQSGDPENNDTAWAFQQVAKLFPSEIVRFVDKNFVPSPYKPGSLGGGFSGGFSGSFGKGYKGEADSVEDPKRDLILSQNPDLAYFRLVSPSTLTMKQRSLLPEWALADRLSPQARELVGTR